MADGFGVNRVISGLAATSRDGDPVDVATGDVLLSQDDVSLPAGSGVLPLIVSRAYRSSRRSGRWFGPSWASTFDQRLLVSPDGVAATFADGTVTTGI